MKRFLLFMLAMAVMAACTESDTQVNLPNDNTENTTEGEDEGTEKPDEGEDEGNDNPTEGEDGGDEEPSDEYDTDLVIAVALEGNGTRVHLDNEGCMAWNEGDILSVFFKSAERQQWQFQGATGDKEGIITPVGEVLCPATEGNIVVAYPDSEAYAYDMEAARLTTHITNTQEYTTNGYNHLLVAQSSNKEVVLREVYGWLRLNITGAGYAIASITVRGNDDEQLTGAMAINPDDATATLLAGPEAGGEVTLRCEGGVALNSTEATALHIALVPQIFERGATIVINDTAGGMMTLEVDKEFKILRNAQTIIRLEYYPDDPEGGNEEDPEGGNEEDDDWVDDGLIEAMYPYDTSIWYNTPDGTQIGLTESPTNGAITGHMFGACANGMCYGYYTIDFDAVVTEIRAKAFYASALEVIFLPTMVREIGAEAFAACEALTTVHIGRNAKSIGDRAFADCVNLQALYLRTTTPPTLGASALPQGNATAGMLIYVPMEAVERYKADAAWRAYADIIVGHEYKYIPKNQ